MPSKKILLGVVMIGAVVAFGVFFFTKNRAKEEHPRIVQVKTISLCDFLQEKGIKNDCVPSIKIINEAVNARDATACKRITDKTFQESCIDQIAQMQVVEKDDVSFCATAANQEDCRTSYFIGKALARHDLLLCDPITEKKAKEQCRDYVTNGVPKQTLEDIFSSFAP